MKEYGWIDGQNISIEYRFAEGKEDALPRLAAHLVAANEGGGAVRDLEITATVFAHVHRRD
jgi:hypothetical protein